MRTTRLLITDWMSSHSSLALNDLTLSNWLFLEWILFPFFLLLWSHLSGGHDLPSLALWLIGHFALSPIYFNHQSILSVSLETPFSVTDLILSTNCWGISKLPILSVHISCHWLSLNIWHRLQMLRLGWFANIFGGICACCAKTFADLPIGARL